MAIPIEPRAPVSVPQGPLVTSAEPVITPDAVTALSNAFRSGYITSQDIIDRMGKTGVLKRRAEEQAALEMVDPVAIAARRKTMEAGAAEAELARQTAEANQGLVSARTQATRAQLANVGQTAEFTMPSRKEQVEAWQSLSFPLPRKFNAQGKPTQEIDYDWVEEKGHQYALAFRQLQMAQMGLAGERVQFTDPSTGNVYFRLMNKFGEDITVPPQGKVNRAREHWLDMQRKALSVMHTPPDMPTPPKPGADSAATAAAVPGILTADNVAKSQVRAVPDPYAAPMIGMPPAPDTPENNALRAAVLNHRPGVTGSQVATMSEAELRASLAAPAITPAAFPVVSPGKTVAEYAGEGTLEKFGPGQAPTEQMKALEDRIATMRQQEFVKNWAEKTPAIQGFYNVVAAYQSQPETLFSDTNQMDVDLARAVQQMGALSSSGAARGMPEEQVKAIEKAQSLLRRVDSVRNVTAEVLRLERFDEKTRRDLIEVGKRRIAALEAPARSEVQRVIGTGVPVERLNDFERSLLTPSAAAATGHTTAGTPGTSKTVTLSGGLPVTINY